MWEESRCASRLPGVITFRRFKANRCFCIRQANRKFCICWRCDGFAEFLKRVCSIWGCWHAASEEGACTCADPGAVIIKTTSFGDAGLALTCGLCDEYVFNSVINVKFRNWKHDCIFGRCEDCKDKFPSCPIAHDTNEETSWNEYAYVPKLRKGQKLDEATGLLMDGSRPKTQRELMQKTGTRYQLMRAFKLRDIGSLRQTKRSWTP